MSPHPAGRTTLADVAAHAGVSVALASIVMRDAPGASPQTRTKVRRTADLLGYRPDARARLLRSAHSRLLGVVFGAQHDFHADLLADLYTAAEQRGYELALSAVTPSRDEKRAINSLLNDRCEALILLGPDTSSADLVTLASRMPVLVLARRVRAAPVDVVRTADELGARTAVDHLVMLGHRRIAYIDGGRAPGAAERRRGYRRALVDHNIAGAEQIITGGIGEEDGARAARQLLAAPSRPTAIAVFNDRCALGALDVLREKGISVPGDVSVVGYDDSRLARLSTVALTTIAQDTAQLTALAVDRAVDRLAGRRIEHRELVVRPHLVTRLTTAPPA